MSKAKFEIYIVGDGKKPEWLVAETNGGRIKMVFEDDELLYAIVNTAGGIKKAQVGDVILKQKTGLAVVSKEKAVKFKLIPNVKMKKEEKKNEQVEQ